MINSNRNIHSNKNSFRREITNAKTHRRVLIVVEGVADPSFYEELLKQVADDTSFKVINVSRFSLGTGCTQVINQLKELQDYLTDDLLRYVRGIIDRDSFYYIASEDKIAERNRLKGLLVLRYYSYESHAYTRNNVKKVLTQLTNAQDSMINDQTMDYVMDDIRNKVIQPLYYVGLECLNNALTENENPIFTYGMDNSKVEQYPERKYKISKLDKSKLDQLALDKHLDDTLECVKSIVNGKHLIACCAYEIEYVIKSFEYSCNNSNNVKANYHCNYSDECACTKVDDQVSCYWKNTGRFSAHQIYQLLIKMHDLEELDYLIKEFHKTAIRFK